MYLDVEPTVHLCEGRSIAPEMIFLENVRNVYGVICTWNTGEREERIIYHDLCYKLLIDHEGPS